MDYGAVLPPSLMVFFLLLSGMSSKPTLCKSNGQGRIQPKRADVHYSYSQSHLKHLIDDSISWALSPASHPEVWQTLWVSIIFQRSYYDSYNQP